MEFWQGTLAGLEDFDGPARIIAAAINLMAAFIRRRKPPAG
jgi:hypothetical protein